MRFLLAILINVFLSNLILYAQPGLAYIIPDIGAPGMNINYEILSPYQSGDEHIGNFGDDGFYLNNPGDDVRVVVENLIDTNKVIFGPIVVSWDGRLISGQIFIKPNVKPNSSDWKQLQTQFRIPFHVFTSKLGWSVTDTFYILQPQKLGDVSGNSETVLGEGSLGYRSKRGAMLVDSLILGGKTYRISTNDCDPNAPGNQGLLPFVLLSKNRISGQLSTIIEMNGGYQRIQNAAPGGGGGGGRFYDRGLFDSKNGDDGGNGFISGGAGGANSSGIPGNSNSHKKLGESTFSAGYSLNRNTPPLDEIYEASGGATAHPFGESGIACNDGDNCKPFGGFGGGSGNNQTKAGGSAGNAIDGQGPNNSAGKAVGNRMLIPLAGGSGGASGNPQGAGTFSGSGGGGGGAISIGAMKIEYLNIQANGANGGNEPADGGNGAGGGIILAPKLDVNSSKAEASGGTLGAYSASYGRLKIEKNLAGVSINNTPQLDVFEGFTTDTTNLVQRDFILKGTKNASEGDLELYIKPETGNWSLDTTIPAGQGNWTANINLPNPDTLFYLVGMMKINNPLGGKYLDEPSGVFSQAGANILEIEKKSDLFVSTDHIDFGISSKCADSVIAFTVENKPTASKSVTLQTWSIKGPDAGNFNYTIPPALPKTLAPGESVAYEARYIASMPEGPKSAYLEFETDSPEMPIIRIDLSAEMELLHVDVKPINPPAVIDFGDMYLGFDNDTTITLTNLGRINHYVYGVLMSNPELSVFPFGGLLAANQANQIDFKFTLNSLQVGEQTFYAKFLFNYQCNDTIDLCFKANLIPAEYTIPDSVTFSLISPCDTQTDSIYIENNSDAPYIIDAISIPMGNDVTMFNTSNNIVTFPDTLWQGEKRIIVVVFNPNQAPDGVKTAYIEVKIDINGEEETIPIFFKGEVKSGFINSTSNLAYGAIVINTTKSLDFTLTNNGIWDVQISNFTPAFTYPTIFTYTNPGSFILSPGGSRTISVDFKPSNVQLYIDKFTFDYKIGNCPLMTNTVDLSGEGLPAISIEIYLPDLVVEPNIDNYQIPIYAKVANPRDTLYGFNLDTMKLEFNRTLFYPKTVSGNNALILSNQLNGNNRELTLALRNITISAQDSVLCYLNGFTMLGNTESTPINITQINYSQFNLVSNITSKDGSLKINICKNGGDRLLDVTNNPLGMVIKPNPASDNFDIDIQVLEIGHYEVSICDITGNSSKIAKFDIDKNASKNYNTKIDATKFSSGVYRIVIKSPTENYSLPLIIVK
ncbi:MAG: hypothetical protein A2X64_09015 [Ignavibacteria bacterium GWF2_33_9]|nr:MAG: hypothetical protein A2X64_09015 [Ignavibacteria bacterium GWF2_33_9]